VSLIPSRLRWQLTLSHLLAIAVTLVAMVGAVVLIAAIAFGLHRRTTSGATDDAQVVAASIGAMVPSRDVSALDVVLNGLAEGTLRTLSPGYGGPVWTRGSGNGAALHDIAYIAIVGPNQTLIAGSSGVPIQVNETIPLDWSVIAAAALAGKTSGAALQARGSGTVRSLAAYPVVDDAGRPIAAIVVAKTTVATSSRWPSPLIVLAAFGAASVAVLVGASLIAFVASSLVAYLLSRNLVGRLEGLSTAARALAAGDLAARVDEGRNDEVGALARKFNAMGAELQRQMAALATERDRVRGVLHNRSQLVADVSHELRTPVATVHGYLEAALQDGGRLPDALRADLQTMDEELSRLQRLVDDLFTLSRADVDRLNMRRERVDVACLLRRVADRMAPLAWRQRRVEVVAEVDDSAPAALADADRLDQIVVNLIANAVRHTPPGGLVAVALSTETDSVRIDVRDTGSGIAPDELAHVFERFYQSRQERAGGAGLGLAVVNELAEGMGGSATATSVPGEGSCFAVRVPRA
jgi:signal transduction histidine kinase